MPPNRFESEVESFLEGSHGDRTHIKRADHPRLHHYAGRYSARPRHRPRAPQPGPPDPPAPSIPVGPVVLSTIRLVSRPALALPPPTGTAARPCGPSGAFNTCGAWSRYGAVS